MNLGCSGDDSERSEKFWFLSTIEMKRSVEKDWLDKVWKCERKPNFGMRNLDPILEERCLNKLELAGPLVDGYLKQIGEGIMSKLGRSRNTGLMPPVRLYVPFNIFRHICNLCIGYGSSLESLRGKHMSFAITSVENASKIFSPARFSGGNILKKRQFQKVAENGRSVLQYKGKAIVLVSESTPILFKYSTKQEKLLITFYVQRYDRDDFALDLQLQKLDI